MGANLLDKIPINSIVSNNNSISTKHSKNTKTAIIELLSKEWPLSMKQIHSLIKKKYCLELTYQAVHKAIKELLSQKTINKEDNKYMINIDWIRGIKDFCSELESSYLNKLLDKDNNYSTFSVNCLWDLYLFVLKSFTELFDPKNKTICCHSEYVWISPIGTEKEWNTLKLFLKDKQMLVLIHSNTQLDNVLKKSWESTGMKYKLGIDTETSKLMMDMFIIGNNIIQIHYPQEFVDLTKTLYQNTTSINDLNMQDIQNFFYKKYPDGIHILIHKNEIIADRIRKRTEQEFKS